MKKVCRISGVLGTLGLLFVGGLAGYKGVNTPTHLNIICWMLMIPGIACNFTLRKSVKVKSSPTPQFLAPQPTSASTGNPFSTVGIMLALVAVVLLVLLDVVLLGLVLDFFLDVRGFR